MYPATPPIDEPQAWAALQRIALEGAPLPGPDWLDGADLAARALLEHFLPLLRPGPPGRPQVIAHLAQSLDGRIALPDGRSKWITGEADLAHTHRLRALCDAVLVGTHTVACDDPQLTVRRVPGRNPLRVILDPRRRLSADHVVFHDAQAPTLVLTGRPGPARLGQAEVVELAAVEGILAPDAILAVLHSRGIRRLLIEGGGITISRFLQAGRVDRLQLAVAPVLLGQGRHALHAPLGLDLASLPRPTTRVLPLGGDWLFDCLLEPAP